MRRWIVTGTLGLLLSSPLAAQTPPPIQGTVALKGTMTKFYRALNTLVVTTMDGVEHVYHFTANVLVHGSKGTGPDALAGLRPGTTVVVHYRTINGADQSAEEIDAVEAQGLKIAEGVVTRLDLPRREIVLRFNDGTTDTLRLSWLTGFRTPTMNELYRGFRVGNTNTQANAALKAEESHGPEAAFTMRRDRWTGRAVPA